MSEVPVLNLKELYGKEYRISKDPAVEKYQKIVDPMYYVIKGKLGEIYPNGGNFLAVVVTGKRTANKMRKWKELKLIQDADDGVTFVFLPELFEKIRTMIKVSKKREISDAHKQKLKQGYLKYRKKALLRKKKGPRIDKRKTTHDKL